MTQPLTPHQFDIGSAVTHKVREQRANRVVLEGAAGTGKTYLSSILVKQLLNDRAINPSYMNGPVFVTAPTNKALSVLQKKISIPSDRIVFSTIHAALGMRMVTNNDTGVRKFVPAYSETAKFFTRAKACIVDEASMVNSEILGYLSEHNFPIIFVGDSNQINPVKELITPVFNQGWPTFGLTEIVRQGKGNPIIDLSRDLDMIFFQVPNMIEGKGYTFNTGVSKKMIDNLASVNGTDELKYVAYMNDDVDEINSIIRHRLYGERPAKVELGETIVFDEPYGPHYTNKELKITNINIITDFIQVPTQKTRIIEGVATNTDLIKMKYYLTNDGVRIIHEDSEVLFKSLDIYLKEKSVKFGWGWKAYYWFIEQFAKYKYNHAITVHKSQGSTFKECIVNVGNINRCKENSEKVRLLYTAVTRASDILILHNVK